MSKIVEQNDSTLPDEKRDAILATADGAGVEALGVSICDRLPALCDRVRQLAAATADETLAEARQQADGIVAAATAQAESEYKTQIAKVRERLERQQNHELQNLRLAARARIDIRRWDELTKVLDEAERIVERLHKEDGERYFAALVRFVESARDELASDRVVVQVSAKDVEPIRQRLADDAIEIVEADITGGVVVGTPDGNVVIDHSIQRRRDRLDSQLRLAAREILFDETV